MNERRMIVVLLTVIAVVLTRNLVANGTRTAEAQYADEPIDPVLVSGTVVVLNEVSTLHQLYRFWSDGRVDASRLDYMQDFCDPPVTCTVEILPASCGSDTDRNGNVEFPDLLNVLSDWGPCD